MREFAFLEEENQQLKIRKFLNKKRKINNKIYNVSPKEAEKCMNVKLLIEVIKY